MPDAESPHQLSTRHFGGGCVLCGTGRRGRGVAEHLAVKLGGPSARVVLKCQREIRDIAEADAERFSDDGVPEIGVRVDVAEAFARDEVPRKIGAPRADETIARGGNLDLTGERDGRMAARFAGDQVGQGGLDVANTGGPRPQFRTDSGEHYRFDHQLESG